MQIVNTYKCNFRCNHCLYRCGPNRKGYLSTKDLEIFLDNYSDEYINYCGGETFLHPEWEDQLKIIARKCSSLRIVSNGSKFVNKKYNETKVLEKFISCVNEILYENKDIDITLLISNDCYHRKEWGEVDLKLIIKIIEYNIIEYCSPRIIVEKDIRDKMNRGIISLGRALDFGIYDYNGICNIEEEEENRYIDMTLDPYGRIYACCNMAGYLGTINTPKEIIEERSQKIKKQSSCFDCRYINGLDNKRIKEWK